MSVVDTSSRICRFEHGRRREKRDGKISDATMLVTAEGRRVLVGYERDALAELSPQTVDLELRFLLASELCLMAW
jgi:hypothetical protein